ncbi:hypothetical protein NDU88_002503 [Pleurodeles waltl]|uniref:Endonuclease/exonuclease/phosphatase domain-containing protein n=1 Tax=Pleurodeles waltl TaxID=8319 RepID=A0AAV7KSZ7_PLEWA|nr:hypothetical protein NDU88_002503 [Pleurodeles waltl]
MVPIPPMMGKQKTQGVRGAGGNNSEHVLGGVVRDGRAVGSFALINVRSLPKHKFEINELILTLNIDCLFLTETWARPDSDPDFIEAAPTGFSFHRVDRNTGRGGGLAIICRSEFTCTWNSARHIPEVCEAMAFKLLLDKSHVFEGLLIYRPPGPVSKFLSIWTSLLEPLIMAPKAIILGDFNIHFDNTSDLLVAEFLNLMVVLDWVLKDGMATHRAGHILDGIFTHPEEELYLSTTPLEWMDHALLTFKFLARQQPIIPIPQKKLTRSWRNIEAEPLKVTLTHNWNDLKASTLSPLARFNLGIKQAMDSLAPARISVPRTRKKPNQPWFSQALKLLQRKYRQKERCWKLSPREAERVELKLALNIYKEACRAAKSDYFTRKISEAANSSRELFRTVNDLTTPLGTPKVENSQDFCNKVAKFF